MKEMQSLGLNVQAKDNDGNLLVVTDESEEKNRVEEELGINLSARPE
jgi:hypothetical protein